METFVPETVRIAAVFLDRNLPGWEHYINEAELDMASYQDCPLGQLWRNHPAFAGRANEGTLSAYSQAVLALGLYDQYNVFDGTNPADRGNRSKWLKEIAVRLAQPPVRDLSRDRVVALEDAEGVVDFEAPWLGTDRA